MTKLLMSIFLTFLVIFLPSVAMGHHDTMCKSTDLITGEASEMPSSQVQAMIQGRKWQVRRDKKTSGFDRFLEVECPGKSNVFLGMRFCIGYTPKKEKFQMSEWRMVKYSSEGNMMEIENSRNCPMKMKCSQGTQCYQMNQMCSAKYPGHKYPLLQSEEEVYEALKNKEYLEVKKGTKPEAVTVKCGRRVFDMQHRGQAGPKIAPDTMCVVNQYGYDDSMRWDFLKTIIDALKLIKVDEDPGDTYKLYGRVTCPGIDVYWLLYPLD